MSEKKRPLAETDKVKEVGDGDVVGGFVKGTGGRISHITLDRKANFPRGIWTSESMPMIS